MNSITYPCWHLSQTLFVMFGKGGQDMYKTSNQIESNHIKSRTFKLPHITSDNQGNSSIDTKNVKNVNAEINLTNQIHVNQMTTRWQINAFWLPYPPNEYTH